MSDEPQPTRKYGRRSASGNPITPWFMKAATTTPSPTLSASSSSASSQEEEPQTSDPFASTPAQPATPSRRLSRRSGNTSFDFQDPIATEDISPTTTPRTRNRTLPPASTNGTAKSAVPTPNKTAVRRLRSDPFAFDAGETPAGPPPKRVRKAVAIPESLIAPAPSPSTLPPATAATPPQPQCQNPPKVPADEPPTVPKSVQQPSPPPPAHVVAKPTLPASLQLEPISAADTDAFAFDLPPPLPALPSSSAAPTSRPPVSQPAPPRLVIPRSESQLLGNFFDSDEDDDDKIHPPSPPEPILIVKTLKRKASMDVASPQPSKKHAPAGGGVLDADPFSDPFDSQGSAGTPVEIRTLHEMREAGENRRITEEAEFLAQGLDSTQPLTLRQYSALDLLRKLSKPAQRRKLASNNSLALLLTALSSDSDPIIMLCFLLTVHAILTDPDIQHVAVESLALDKYLFQPHLTSTLSSTSSPTVPTAASKQARVMLSDLHALAESLAVPTDMLTVRLLWIANMHKLVHLAPTAVASAMATDHVSALIQGTLATGLCASDWTSGTYLADTLGLLDQLSFVCVSVAQAFTCAGADAIVAVARFGVRTHDVLASKAAGHARPKRAGDEWHVAEADLAAGVLAALRIVINVTHAEPKAIDALVAAEGGKVVRGLVAVGVNLLTGTLGMDPVWVAVHCASAGRGASAGTGGGAAPGGYSQSSQSQPMAAPADVDAVASLSDRSNPKLVAVGLLLNLAEGAPEVVGKALAGMHVASLVDVVESGPAPEHEAQEEAPVHVQSMATGVISAFAAVVLATALGQMDATAREEVRTKFACATWGGLKRALERFVEYQQVGDEEAEAGGTSQEVGKDELTNGHRLLRQVSEWL